MGTYVSNKGLGYNLAKALHVTFKVISIYMMGKDSIVVLGIFLFLATTCIAYVSKRKICKDSTAGQNRMQPLVFLSGNVVLGCVFAALCVLAKT